MDEARDLLQRLALLSALRCDAASAPGRPLVTAFFEDLQHVQRCIDFDDEPPIPVLLDRDHLTRDAWPEFGLLMDRLDEDVVAVACCVLRPSPPIRAIFAIPRSLVEEAAQSRLAAETAMEVRMERMQRGHRRDRIAAGGAVIAATLSTVVAWTYLLCFRPSL